MRKLLLSALLLASPACLHALDSIPVASLGALKLDYQQPAPVTALPGETTLAEVTVKQGEAFTLVAPARIEQIHYLAEVGSPVQKGEAFAVVRGPEMHHFLAELGAARDLYELAKRRFENNRALYQKQAIGEGQWLEISQYFYQARLEFEHINHFYELVISAEEGTESITLGAPAAGLLVYTPTSAGTAAGEVIAEFIAPESIRLKLNLPSNQTETAVLVTTTRCELPIVSVGTVASGFFVEAWSASVPAECNLRLGQTISARPFYRADAYRLDSSAILEWENTSHVLIKQGEYLVPTPIEIMASEGSSYFVTAAAGLKGQQVLVTSVSAVQGVLLGLGGE
jgi:hypothetical protein